MRKQVRERVSLGLFVLCFFLGQFGLFGLNDENFEKYYFDLDDFEEIAINGYFDVSIRQGNISQAVLSYEKDDFNALMEAVSVSVDDDETLLIRPKTESSCLFSKVLDNDGPLPKIEITVQEELKKVKFYGEGTLDVLVEQGDELEIRMKGGVESFIRFTGKELRCSVSGKGHSTLLGETEREKVIVTGLASLNSTQLEVKEKSEAVVRGAGFIELGKSPSVFAQVVGSGKISYQGEPELEKSLLGLGKIFED